MTYDVPQQMFHGRGVILGLPKKKKQKLEGKSFLIAPYPIK
jgi:hypothetical protein